MRFEIALLQKCWFVSGPTAVGKSALSLLLAERLDGEIVALDSMTVYRGMDIGTAKPSRVDREQVPHHMLDLIDPHEEYSVAQYVETAERVCSAIVERGRVPLFVGGTGLYLRSILRGVFDGPPADWALREQLTRDTREFGANWLHEQLAARDPEAAARLHPNDQRRVIRAIEVVETTGLPISRQQQQTPLPEADRPRHVYWLEPPRDWLYDRINRRVEAMIESGLVGEVRTLLNREPPPGRTARQGLGYKEVIEHLEDSVSLDETIDRVQTRTRQFAKRQHTWLRNLVECKAIPCGGTASPESIVDRLCDIEGRAADG